MNDESKAEQFLQEARVNFSAKFTHYGGHFEDETENRDNFRCTFSRGRKRLVINYGQSLALSDGAGGSPPHPYEVLACITKRNPWSFSEFCSDYGYSEDSRKAKKLYKATLKEWKGVEAFFTAEEREALQEIQ